MRNLRPHQQLERDPGIPYRNVRALYAEKAAATPERKFLICPGTSEESFSYREFESAYLRLAVFVARLGLKQGDRMNIVFSNSSEFLAFYFAGLTLGVSVVPINAELSVDEISYIVTDCGAKAVFHQSSLHERMAAVRLRIDQEVQIHSIELLADCIQGLGKSDVDRLLVPDIPPEDEAIIIYTSGTSGNPKGVVLSHINLLADAKAISSWFGFTQETRTLCILPLFHNNGQVTTLLAPLYAGGSTAIVKGKASLMAFWGLVKKYEASWTSVMPSILSVLLASRIERQDTSMLGILCGGQILDPNVQARFEEQFRVPVFEGYGLTETTSFACINGFPASKRVPGSVGRPLPVNDMAILDPDGRVLEPGQEGEIVIRGYNVAIEYLHLPERNAKSFEGGWFHSGDYGTMDAGGNVYFKGRKDFLIIKGGENIYPAELENVLYQHPAVAECAVIGIHDKILGEDLCAFVKLHQDQQLTEPQLKEFCKGKIAPYKYAKKILILNQLPDLPEIPKGPTKKVLYRKLQEYYTERNPTPV